MTTTWKIVRVFISSTFRDMQAERDHLVRFVFPRLREQMLPHRIHLVDVDLRWGVTSEQDVSEVCHEIIEECRPRFLCMLGGRYGWVPPGKDRSITDDEVHYGVLDQPLKDRGFAYFYFRDEAATTAMMETTPGEFRETQGSDNQNKFAELKQAIIAAGLNPFTYQAQWDNESCRLTGLKQFGDRVYNDLLASLKSDPELQDRFMADAAAQPDEFDEENAAMEAFVEERSERFVLGSRETVLNELLAHASATGGNGYVCLTGAPGSGKSALLAHLSRHSTLNAQPSTLLVRHFVGASPGSTDVRRTLRRLCHELKAGCPDITADIPDDPEKLRVAFSDFLRQACARQRVVILVDALSQFDPSSNFIGLYWLPEELPTNARFILSALDGPALEELRRRPHKPREIELKPLTVADGDAITEQFRKRYRKKFEPDQRAALLAKTGTGTPLYLLAALEELRTLGTYEEITQRIAELPPTTHDLFAWILKRLENDDGFRDAAGRRVGRELVSRFAALLGASRHGLSQHELADLLDVGDPQGNVAALLHLLRPYLMRRGELLDFYHGQFRVAAEEAWLKTDAQRQAAHAQLGDYFHGQDNFFESPEEQRVRARRLPPTRPLVNARKIDELLWQRMRARHADECKRLLMDTAFLEASCWRDLDQLIEDFRSALTVLRNDAASSDDKTEVLFDILRTLTRDGPHLREHPYLLSQQLLNDALALGHNAKSVEAWEGILKRMTEECPGWVQLNALGGPGRESWRTRLASTITHVPNEVSQLLPLSDGRVVAVLETGDLWAAHPGFVAQPLQCGVSIPHPVRSAQACGSTVLLHGEDGAALVLYIDKTMARRIGHMLSGVEAVTATLSDFVVLNRDGTILLLGQDGQARSNFSFQAFSEVSGFAASPDGRFLVVVETPNRNSMNPAIAIRMMQPGVPITTGLSSNVTVIDLAQRLVLNELTLTALIMTAAPWPDPDDIMFILSYPDALKGGRYRVNDDVTLLIAPNIASIATSANMRYQALLRHSTVEFSGLALQSINPAQVQIIDHSNERQTLIAPFVLDRGCSFAFTPSSGESTFHIAAGSQIATIEMGRLVWVSEAGTIPISEAQFDHTGISLIGRNDHVPPTQFMWDVKTGELIEQLQESIDGPATAVLWSPNGTTGLVCYPDAVEVVDAEGNTLRWIRTPKPSKAAWSHDGRLCVFSSDSDRKIRLLRFEGNMIRDSAMSMEFHGMPTALAVSPSRSRFALATGPVAISKLPGPTPEITLLESTPPAWENTISLVDAATGLVHSITPPSEAIITAMLFVNETLLVVADRDGEVRWIDTERNCIVGRWWSLAPIIAMAKHGDEVLLADTGAASMNLPVVYQVQFVSQESTTSETQI